MSHAGAPLFACEDLTIEVPGRLLIEQLQLSVDAGEFVAVLGPNGVGKSLSLFTFAGIGHATAGEVTIGGQGLQSMSRRDIALALALLPQYTEDIFPATVLDTVMIGRHPHIGRFQWETRADREIALDALMRVDLALFADRDVLTLSGGERRRLAVAQVLTQEPELFLLDEPTNHLDPQHQLDVLRLFRDKASEGKGVIVTLHDVNLAARFADRCLLLFGDGRWVVGETGDVLTEDRLSTLYGTPIETVPWRDGRVFVAAG